MQIPPPELAGYERLHGACAWRPEQLASYYGSRRCAIRARACPKCPESEGIWLVWKADDIDGQQRSCSFGLLATGKFYFSLK